MNLRCAFCQTPYTIGRIEKLIALQHLDAEKLTHYDAHCPRCRRATPVLRQKLEATFPNWRDALHELEQHADTSPASTSTPESVSASQTESTPHSAPAKGRTRTHAKAKVESKPAAKTSSPKGKVATKKSK